MAEEHHIANLDPSAFFTLHDFDNDGSWSGDEIRRTYGLDDESAKDVEETKKADVVKTVKEIFDKDGDGVISKEEWIEGWMKEGKRLPDFGVGVATSSCYLLVNVEEAKGGWGVKNIPFWSIYCCKRGGRLCLTSGLGSHYARCFQSNLLWWTRTTTRHLLMCLWTSDRTRTSRRRRI